MARNCRGWRFLLTAHADTLYDRIEKRLQRERRRRANRVEEDIDLHIRAQEELLLYAQWFLFPIISTDDKTPAEIAAEIEKRVRE